MPTPRYGACSAKLGNNIYIIGGVEHDSYENTEKVSKVVEMYNTETNSWDRNIGELDEKRYNATAVAFNEKIYVFGGKEKQNEWVDDIEVYDPVLNKWEEVEPEMLEGREGAAAVVHENKIYLIGGIDSHGTYLNKVDIFDPQINQWSTSPFRLNDQRAFFSAVSINDTVYVLGGFFPDPINQVEKLIPGSGWQSINSMSTQRASFAACAINETIYVMGGRGQTGVLKSAEAFVTTNNDWFSAEPLIKPRDSFTAQQVENKIYIFGGSNSEQQFISDVEVFTPVTSVKNYASTTVTKYLLYQNYPNPFNSLTVIKYQLGSLYSYSGSNQVSLSIFNIFGQQITVLIDKLQKPGSYQTRWNGKDQYGNDLPSGIYFCKLKTENIQQVIKITLIR